MRCTKRTPIDDDAENAVIRPLEACVSLSLEGTSYIVPVVVSLAGIFFVDYGVTSLI